MECFLKNVLLLSMFFSNLSPFQENYFILSKMLEIISQQEFRRRKNLFSLDVSVKSKPCEENNRIEKRKSLEKAKNIGKNKVVRRSFKKENKKREVQIKERRNVIEGQELENAIEKEEDERDTQKKSKDTGVSVLIN